MNVPSLVSLWGSIDANDFSQVLECTHREVVHWRLNSFKVPAGKSGKEFVRKLSRLYSAFASASSMESIALKATVVMPILLLQKPQQKSKIKYHIACLERRLRVWKEGNFNELLLEGRTIQNRLPKSNKPNPTQNQSHTFANLMFAGKVKAAIDLSRTERSSILHLHEPSGTSDLGSPLVRETLISKHPQGSLFIPSALSPQPHETHIQSFLNRSMPMQFGRTLEPGCL